MALITCPECGNQIASNSRACVHCGYIVNDVIIRRKATNKHTIEAAIVMLFIFGLLYTGIFTLFLLIPAVKEGKNNSLKKHILYRKNGVYYAYDINGNLYKNVNPKKIVKNNGTDVYLLDKKKILLGYAREEDLYDIGK